MSFSSFTITHSVYKMDNVKKFKDLFESIPNCRNVVSLMFFIKNENIFKTEYGFLRNDVNRLCKEFKNILLEQNEEYLD